VRYAEGLHTPHYRVYRNDTLRWAATVDYWRERARNAPTCGAIGAGRWGRNMNELFFLVEGWIEDLEERHPELTRKEVIRCMLSELERLFTECENEEDGEDDSEGI